EASAGADTDEAQALPGASSSARPGDPRSNGAGDKSLAEMDDEPPESAASPAPSSASSEAVEAEPSSTPLSGPVSEPAEEVPASKTTGKVPPDIVATVFGRTDVGQIREHNEDNFLIADLSTRLRGIGASKKEMRLGRGGILFAVCDGMGGAAAGEVA